MRAEKRGRRGRQAEQVPVKVLELSQREIVCRSLREQEMSHGNGYRETGEWSVNRVSNVGVVAGSNISYAVMCEIGPA